MGINEDIAGCWDKRAINASKPYTGHRHTLIGYVRRTLYSFLTRVESRFLNWSLTLSLITAATKEPEQEKVNKPPRNDLICLDRDRAGPEDARSHFFGPIVFPFPIKRRPVGPLQTRTLTDAELEAIVPVA